MTTLTLWWNIGRILGAPMIWMSLMVFGWLLDRAEVEAHNDSATKEWELRPELPWNWRVLVSPGLYRDWVEASQPRYLLPPKTSHE